MAEIQIGFVPGLKTEDSVTENLLTSLHDVQTPIGGIVEWNALRISISTSRISSQYRKSNLGPTEEPVDVDQRTNVGHHVQNFRCVYQRRCLSL